MSNEKSPQQRKIRHLHVIEGGRRLPRKRVESPEFAVIGSTISFDPKIFDTYCFEGWGDIHWDLLTVCASVEYADRRWARSRNQWSRSLHVTVPVRMVETWENQKTKRNLVTALRHLTGDEWSFSFIKDQTKADYDRQYPLFVKENKEFVIAYSDGLDSLCVATLYNQNDIAVCVRISKHNQLPKGGKRPPFDRLPFEVNVPTQEDSVRSRGFKFAAITAIAAQLTHVSRVLVPESGQGSLGSVLLPLIDVYPDYRNHPSFLRLMERFINRLLGCNICYEQPRLWHTKGETIAAFLAQPGTSTDEILDTRSCWQQRHNVRYSGQLRQCGICAACLLRRMSLHAANVYEPPDRYTVADLSPASYTDAVQQIVGIMPTATLVELGYMGVRHLDHLARLASSSQEVLNSRVYELSVSLGISQDDAQSKLQTLLHRHADEWQGFLSSVGERSFLNYWTSGERYG